MFSLCYTSLLLPLRGCGCGCGCGRGCGCGCGCGCMNYNTHSHCLKIVNSCATSTHIPELCQLLLQHRRI
ncbi:hypothetical protein AMTRI_Chr07g27490 [Amborella trichopoda]